MRSSISSSEKSFPRKGLPRALLAGLAIVCLVEITLHIIPAQKLLGYGAGLGSYYEVAHTIQDLGAADVAILGTSRGRESIVMPWLCDRIRKDFDATLSVANYSCAGSHADETHQISELLMSSSRKPKAVIYFLSPGMLQGEESNRQRLGILGKFPDFFSGRTGQVVTAQTEKPFWLMRQWFDRNYLTFRHRHHFRHLLTSLARGRKPVSTIQGDYSMWQIYAANRSLVTHPVSSQRIDAYIARLFNDEDKYVAGEVHLEALAKTIQLYQDNGVPIIVLAAAMSPELQHHMPQEILNTYFDSVQEITEEAGIKFWNSNDLVELTNANFREQSHLNLSGGQKVTEAVYDQLIKPILRQ